MPANWRRWGPMYGRSRAWTLPIRPTGRPLDAALARLDQYDWLVFSSGNGVRYLARAAAGQGGDLRRLGRVKLAAIGPGTAAELARYHLRADLIPANIRAEALAEALVARLAARAFSPGPRQAGRQVLPERLAAAGARWSRSWPIRRAGDQADAAIAAALAEGRIDWVTVTSSAIARSLGRHVRRGPAQAKLASISPITSGVLRELGYSPAAEAAEYTMCGLVEAIRAAESGAQQAD